MAGRQILQNFKLFHERAFVNGKWLCGKRTFPVFNPANGEILADVAESEKDDVINAIDSANSAFKEWKVTSCKYRSNVLKKLAQSLVDNRNELATIMTLECGKPLSESKGEVLYAASFLEWFGEEAKRINGDVLPNIEANIRRLILKQPVGVCAMITPWNFPLGMITRKVGAAIAAGCTTILKPSEETPLTALAFSKLVDDLSLPKGVFNVVTCSKDNNQMIGTLFCEHPDIRKISFTGSTKVGKWLLEKSANTVKRVSLENGGNAPFIVFNSADVKLAAAKAVGSRFRNSGQTCICAEMILVQNDIHDEFVEEFKKATLKLKIGDPLHHDTTMSSLINQSGLDKVLDHVNDAKEKGGKIICGGEPFIENSLFYKPTIISNCDLTMSCVQEETFGPVAPVIKFKTEQEAVDIANNASAGLGGYFFSNDLSQIWRVVENLEVGMVGVNENAISNEIIPFGGVREAGLGREGSIYGINEYLELKLVCLGGI